MTWEQYTKRRLTYLREGIKLLPSQNEILRKIITKNRIWKVDEIVYEMCKRTKLDHSSVERNIEKALNSLVEKGHIICVQEGYYRCR